MARPLAHWLLLLALTVMWGSSFLFTKLALVSLRPDQIVAGRLAIAALILVVAALLGRRRWPRKAGHWLWLGLLAVVGNVVPFLLIAWGQRGIDSGLAGILMAVMPLATLVLAHFAVESERMTARRALGFLLGFGGIVVLTGPEALLQLRGEGSKLFSELAVLGGALCYALNTILTRRRPPGDALTASAGTILIAALLTLPLSVPNGLPAGEAFTPPVVAALLFLGCLSTALATLFLFKLIALAGPSFMSLVNYLVPLWAVAIGFLFLGERPDWRAPLALALILCGVALSERGVGPKLKDDSIDPLAGPAGARLPR